MRQAKIKRKTQILHVPRLTGGIPDSELTKGLCTLTQWQMLQKNYYRQRSKLKVKWIVHAEVDTLTDVTRNLYKKAHTKIKAKIGSQIVWTQIRASHGNKLCYRYWYTYLEVLKNCYTEYRKMGMQQTNVWQTSTRIVIGSTVKYVLIRLLSLST